MGQIWNPIGVAVLGFVLTLIVLWVSEIRSRLVFMGVVNPRAYLSVPIVDPETAVAMPTGGKSGFVFVKTHKTGSTIVTSLILRKCIKERWNCFIPPIGASGHTWNPLSSVDGHAIRSGQGLFNQRFPYDVWYLHTVNSHLIEAAVKDCTGLRVTIVRERTRVVTCVRRLRRSTPLLDRGS